MPQPRLAVVIPCYRVRRHVLEVIGRIGPECDAIFAVDDGCPEQSGAFIAQHCTDPRVRVLHHTPNRGVGGAMKAGYRAALAADAEVIVKLDGDGQMDPRLITVFIAPILRGEADYTKGNRFYSLSGLKGMPKRRIFGNVALSFLTKFSSGYWSIFDPTNGYTAVHAGVLRRLDFTRIADRYFFETSMLVQLGSLRAVVRDIPMAAIYGDEVSHLRIRRVISEFLFRNVIAAVRRVVYGYFLRDFSIASLNLAAGVPLMLFGAVFGAAKWHLSNETGIPATAGTVMIAMLPIILGFQMLLSFISYDIAAEPVIPLQRVSGPGGIVAPTRHDRPSETTVESDENLIRSD